MQLARFQNKKQNKEPITMLTAYDYQFAKLIDKTGTDMILVGDSLGMVMLGYDSTIPVTMEEMLHHAKAVRRGTEKAFVIGDMPYMSYQISIEEAIRNAGRFIKEAGCHGIKLEGGQETAETVRAITRAGIPVMGHIGLTPQTATALGGYKVQGADAETAKRLLKDAVALSQAGAFGIVLECIPSELAKHITETIPIPTIGIGAGRFCDGQVLVTHDLLGIFDKFTPRFVKKYTNLAPLIQDALATFLSDVREGKFPNADHSFEGGEGLIEMLQSLQNSDTAPMA